MKKLCTLAAIMMAFVFVSSCKKDEDEGKLPNISFKTGTGYTSADAQVSKTDTVLIGITASKAESADVLKTFDVSKSVNGGTSTSIYSETLTGTSGDSYSKDIQIVPDSTGTEKVTFTVVNRDGLKNTVSLTLTVH